MAGPRFEGPGPSPSGSGTTTVVGGGSLTSTALVTGGGGSSLQTPSATSTLDSSGNLVIAGRQTIGVSGTSTGVTDLLINPTTKASGNLLDLQVNSVSRVRVTFGGSILFTDGVGDIGAFGATRPANVFVQTAVLAGGSIYTGASLFFGSGATSQITSAVNGNLRISNTAGSDFGLLQFGGTTSSFPALSRSTTKLSMVLADGTSGGLFDATGALINTGITSDATHTDSTVCQDTTTHQFYAGSGAVGICLGTSSVRYKKGIKQLKSGLSAVLGLNPISYRYRKGFGTDSKNLYGFTAEDMIDILPELVGLDAEGAPNSVDMVGLLPVLVNAIKDLAAQNDLLNTRLNTLLDAR